MYLKCPKCGKPFFIMCLTSNPPQYEGECSYRCFSLRYFEREDSFKLITQEELDNTVAS